MILEKIVIKNFKSIKELELEVKKYGDSYTTMFLGINEVGKSNILEAISFLKKPTKKFNFSSIHNQKDEENNDVSITYYFKDNQNCFKSLEKSINFEVINIKKSIYLSQKNNLFEESYDYNVKIENKDLYLKTELSVEAERQLKAAIKLLKSKFSYVGSIDKYKIVQIINFKDPLVNSLEKLTEVSFKKYLGNKVINLIKKNEPSVSFWQPSSEYLISSVNLNDFKNNIESNIPLKNIFILAGYATEQDIFHAIESIKRRKLMSLLSDKVTNYVTGIWKHKIKFDIEITDNNICNISVQDVGQNNKYDYYKMTDRSQGFKQFMSLILSLSIETKKANSKQKLILLDEPEVHLHPSGIRDLGKELLEMGKENYLFVSTHSPYLIDKNNKERNIIIKKDSHACTIKKDITRDYDINDDMVLSEAFGIDVYRDLLNPHKLLVEGASDKLILQKAFKLKNIDYGITNGIGSNIVQVASKFNHEDIKMMVIVDDDKDGREDRDKIIKIGGLYSSQNVFTLKDLVPSLIDNGTIEDLLGGSFIESKFKDFCKKEFEKEIDLKLEKLPLMEQIKKRLQKEKLDKKVLNEKLNQFKKKISEEFMPTTKSLSEKFPLLDELTERIKNKI